MSDLPKHIIDVCKIGQGNDCCKYLVCGAKGFECMKVDSSMKKIIDNTWATTHHVAQGDNCEGEINLYKQ